MCGGRVKFPDAEGFRHPVVLYDGLKNLLLVPYLLHVRRTNPTPGAVAARFVFWYAFLRFFIDLFRDYPTHRLALGTGQTLNLVMAAVGAVLLIRSRMRRLGKLRQHGATTATAAPARADGATTLQRVLFVALAARLSTIPEQLDAGHPCALRQTPPGDAALRDLSTPAHDRAVTPLRPGRAGARPPTPPGRATRRRAWRGVRS